MTDTNPPELGSLKLQVHFEDDSNDVVLEWDENDPVAIALGVNDWTEADWMEALEKGIASDLDEEGE